MKILAIYLVVGAFWWGGGKSPPPDMVEIKSGLYTSFFKEEDEAEEVSIPSFFIDKYPVTNQQFLTFVTNNPSWRKSNTPKVFASEHYLKRWPSDLVIPEGEEQKPVVAVSWFAAKKYCEFYGKRLLTVNEWEYASDAASPVTAETVLAWYSKRNSAVAKVGQLEANKFGVYDMHGLVWEWVDDYASVIIQGDARSDTSRDRSLFCGGGSVGATATNEYATFMRFAFRSSLKGSYAIENLGFRCGEDRK